MSQIHYPNVTALPGAVGPAGTRSSPAPERKTDAEFDQVLTQVEKKQAPDLAQVRSALKFSAHATQRMSDRKIALDPQTLSRINQAVDQAEAKGVEDTLVLTGNAALIVNVPNRTVITAVDRNAMTGNVFTNIDGVVVI